MAKHNVGYRALTSNIQKKFEEMDKKKKSLARLTAIACLPNELVSKKYHGIMVTRELIKVTTVNYESEANNKFDHVGFTARITEFGHMYFFSLATQEPLYCKSNHISLKSMSRGQRTSILAQLHSLGNTPSRVIHRQIGIGISARQIGQFRRHHIEEWRTKQAK
jgi:hypothetical protein